ncbi:MAG TPA: septum formation initiator family protein [Blastocatellia bacterium]
MSQAANTFWANRISTSARAYTLSRRESRARIIIDGAVLAVILAATALCISVYSRTSAELDAANAKHQAAAEKVEQLKIQLEKRSGEVNSIKNDLSVIEAYARQRFGFVRAGDVVINVPNEEKEPSPKKDGVKIANLMIK